MRTSLTFKNTYFDVIDQNGQPWLQSRQLASALGYKDESSVRKLYERNKDEFTDTMTATVKMTVGITPVEVRIFSLRGCHLLAMFARTTVAKEFRVWALDVLEKIEQDYNMHKPQPLPYYHDENRLESMFANLKLNRAKMHGDEQEIYNFVKSKISGGLQYNDTRRTMFVQMHSQMDDLWYSLDKMIDAIQKHAQAMITASRM